MKEGTSCQARERYEPFITALGGVYFNGYKTINESMCFTKAVFGYDKSAVRGGELEQVVRDRMGISSESCPKNNTKRILIQDRKHRRIINSEELANELRSQLNASVINMQFENYTLAEQIQNVFCADVLIGVQGAGLNHLRFLREDSALLEVGWDHWPAGMYASMARRMGIKAITMGNCSANISEHTWKSFYEENGNMRNKTHQEVLKWAGNAWWKGENIWKFADCNLNIEEAIRKLGALLIH